MKRAFAGAVLILTVLLTGCVSAETTSAEVFLEELADSRNTGAVEYSYFFITVEEGWDTMDIIGGVQIYKSTGEMLQIQVDGEGMSEGEDLPLINSVNQNFGGSGVRQTELLGMDFHTVTYRASGAEQCMYTAVIGGRMVKIQATGASYSELPDIRKMVESIKFNIS